MSNFTVKVRTLSSAWTWASIIPIVYDSLFCLLCPLYKCIGHDREEWCRPEAGCWVEEPEVSLHPRSIVYDLNPKPECNSVTPEAICQENQALSSLPAMSQPIDSSTSTHHLRVSEISKLKVVCAHRSENIFSAPVWKRLLKPMCFWPNHIFGSWETPLRKNS